jgi:hypothetical protein
MVRIFGLIVALAALMAPANAALLGKYEFTSGSTSATSVDAGFTAAGGTFNSFGVSGQIPGAISQNGRYEFVGPGTANGSLNAGSTNPYVGFTLNSGAGVTITKLTLDTQQIGAGPDGGFLRAYYTFDSGATWTTYGTAVGYTKANLSTLSSTLELNVPASTTVSFIFRVKNDEGSSQALFIDNVALEFAAVPEPASMAIFGLLGVGAAAGRFRRRK